MSERIGIAGGGAIASGLACVAAEHGQVVVWARRPHAATAKLDPTYLEGGQTKHYNPDQVSRKLGNTAANNATAWYGGKLAARSPYGVALQHGFVIGGFRGESTPGRPNLVACLPGPADGPVLAYLAHVDTVLARPEEWTVDPWSGEGLGAAE